MIAAVISMGIGIIAPASWAAEPKRVVIVQWAVLATYRNAEKHFVEELRSLAQKKDMSIEIETFNAYGDKKSLEDFLGGRKALGADLIVTMGNIATGEAQRRLPDKPVVFLEVLCPAPLVSKDSASRKAVITGASPDLDFSWCLKKVKEKFPSVQRIGVIYTTAQEIPAAQAENLRKAAVPLGVEVAEEKLELGFCRNEADIKMALQKLCERQAPQAIWILDDGNTSRFLTTIIDYCTSKAIRVIGAPSILKKGGDIAFDVNREKLARQAAAHAIRVLEGDSTGSMEFIYDSAPSVVFGEDARPSK
jgi:ABC-type uncharacterized transport system substrate-binding protein